MPVASKKTVRKGGDETRINLNRTGLKKDKTRLFQLACVFFTLRRSLPQDAFAELEGRDGRFYVPYRFCLGEVAALAMSCQPKMFYLELSEDEYIEIQFDELLCRGSQQMVEQCRQAIDQAARLCRSPDILAFQGGMKDPCWSGIMNQPDLVVRNIGDLLFGSGYVMIHPKEREAFCVTQSSAYRFFRGQIEYVEILSNLEPGKFVLFVYDTMQIFACGIAPELVGLLYDLLCARGLVQPLTK